MGSTDVIVIGGGVIGLSVALELKRSGANVRIFDRTQFGTEASWAAGGMIADLDPHLPPELQSLATASAELYPTFVRQVEEVSGAKIDFRTEGTIDFLEHAVDEIAGRLWRISTDEVHRLEPEVKPADLAYFMRENCVDPRTLVGALLKAVSSSGVECHPNDAVQKLLLTGNRVTGVQAASGQYTANLVVNCAGAWASQIAPVSMGTRPVKGQMLALTFRGESTPLLKHVVRSRFCYIIPRSSGRLVVGSTIEPGGFDKSLNAYRIKRLHEAAIHLVPKLRDAVVAETWCGLRPGTMDNLPVLGRTSLDGYIAATGHYRDGVLLAPITAKIVGRLVLGGEPEFDLSRFSPGRIPQN